MEPITFTAIVAALSAGVATGAGKVVENTLVDAYQGLKAALKRRFGDNSEVVEAVDKLEQKPDSEGRKTALQEEVEAVFVGTISGTHALPCFWGVASTQNWSSTFWGTLA
jgi:hypothetical protein